VAGVAQTAAKLRVDTQYFEFAHPPHEQVLASGEKLGPVTIAYETYGALNSDRSNAVLVLHALSGDAHAAGWHKGDTAPGWWDDLIGPGKAFDTDKYYVVCANVLGGCMGSTGPASQNPATGRPFGLDFPLLTIRDMVEAERHLIDHLGVGRLLCVAGGSMGGMQALEWLASYPARVRSAVPIATTLRSTPQQIAFNEVGRQAIMADPNWQDGHYYEGAPPARGLAVARMVGHITYMSDESMARKFGRRLKSSRQPFKFTEDFEVEGYLRHRGKSFVRRFDANSYLYVTKAVDYFDVATDNRLAEALKGRAIAVLVIAFQSDWLYPPYQSRDIVRVCQQVGLPATYCEVKSSYGHDAFLLETEEETHLLTHFLAGVTREEKND
jgi:homoserine O-acetyltransferase/O-succinyltransferase